MHGGSLLAVDLELVHTQPLHLKLLNPEPPDDRPTDRQTPDHQGPDGASADRDRPDRKRANANRAELLQATTGRWGPPDWELEPVHADPHSTDDHNVAATASRVRQAAGRRWAHTTGGVCAMRADVQSPPAPPGKGPRSFRWAVHQP